MENIRFGLPHSVQSYNCATFLKNQVQHSVETKLMYSSEEESDEESSCCDLKSKFCSWQPKSDNLFLQFCQDSTVEGLKYIGEEGQHLLTRIFWTIAVLAAFGMSIYLIHKGVVEPMRANPVIISFQDKEITVNQIPFPAFTLCNANKLKMSAIQNLSRVTQQYAEFIQNRTSPNINSTEIATNFLALQYLVNFCTISQSFSEYFDLPSFFGNESLDVDPELWEKVGFQNIWSHAKQAFHKCDETILLCSWKNKEVPCKELFHPIQTEFGYCCVFNMMPQSVLRKATQNLSYWERNLSRKELSEWRTWDIDVDLINEDRESNFPRHQIKAGMDSGLSILINPELDEYWSSCKAQDSIGFRAQAHNPIETPHIVDFGTTIRPNSETLIAVQAEITTADPGVEQIHKNQRQCYFLGDYILKAFNFYSQTNCLDECMAEITFLACHCVPYYMPRQDQPLCNNVTEYGCLRDLRKNLTRTGIKVVCKHCLPSCTQIRYTTDTSNLPLRDDVGIWKNMSTNLYEKWADKKPAIVHVYFSKNTVDSKVRKSLYGMIDVIADTGGLLGLTLGCSVISLVELFYFIFLRLWNNKSNSTGNQKFNPKLKSVRNNIRPKQKVFIVNPAGSLRLSDTNPAKDKMNPRLTRVETTSIKNT